MSKRITCLVATLINLNSCINPQPAPAPAVPAPPDKVVMALPTRELLGVLEGRWQNDRDSQQTIEVRNARLYYLHSGQVVDEYDLDVSEECGDANCHADSTLLKRGWYFTETGDGGKHCNHILQCDSTTLRYHRVDDTAGVLSYKKI